MTKTGSPHLRWILNQCARAIISGQIRMEDLAKKKEDAKAIVAASAKMLKIIY